MNSNIRVAGRITTPQYKLTIRVKGEGTTSPAPGTYTVARGSCVTVTALPDSGWRFARWYGAPLGCGPVRVITINSNKYITACFTAPQCKLTVRVKGEGTTSPGPGTYTLARGSYVAVTALPDSGWKFGRWYGAPLGCGPARVITMNSSKYITARFIDSGQPGEEIEYPYVANSNTREIHRLDCLWVKHIKDDHKIPCGSLQEVAELITSSGYNGCYYCLTRYDSDTLTSEQVQANFKEDLT